MPTRRHRSPLAKRLVEKMDDSAARPLLSDTPESFAAIGDDEDGITFPRIVVLGATGSGKSTLLNILAGYRATVDANAKGGLAWYKNQEATQPVFKSSDGADSVTTETQMVVTRWLGSGDKIVLVDTPGVLDSRESNGDTWKAMYQRDRNCDLHIKLKHLKNISAVLVLLSDFHSTRLDSSNFQLLKDLANMFESEGSTFWEHVIVGYSKMNMQTDVWKDLFPRKKIQLQTALKELQGQVEPVSVEVLPLGGVERDATMMGGELADEVNSIQKLRDMLKAMPRLSTADLQLTEGDAEKYDRQRKDYEAIMLEIEAQKDMRVAAEEKLDTAKRKLATIESVKKYEKAMHRAVWAAIVPFCLLFVVLCMFGLCYWWLILFVVIPFCLYRLGKADAGVIVQRLAETRGQALVDFAKKQGCPRVVGTLQSMLQRIRMVLVDGEAMAPEHEHAN